jgi:hypothetical protein
MVVFWTSLMVGCLTLVATLATTSMNHRQAARLAAESRAELRRDAARELVVEVLVTGREWVSNGELMVPALTGLRPSPTSHALVTSGVEAPVGQDDP